MCNSSNIEDSELVILAAVRGSSGFLCAVITTVLLAAISISSDKSSVTQRLLVYLTLSSLLALLASTLQAESAGCSTPWHRPFCEAVGFLGQFTSWLLLLVSVWLSAVISLNHWCPNHRVVLTAKRDAIVWGVLVSVSFLFSAIPLATQGYGMHKAWCWIQSSRLIEQWMLWYGWMIVAIITSLLMLVTALSCQERRLAMYYESSRGVSNTKHKASRAVELRIKILTLCMSLYLLGMALFVALSHIRQISDTFAFLVASAILEPLGVISVPVIFATSLHDLKPRGISTSLGVASVSLPSQGNHKTSLNSETKKKGSKNYKDFSDEITSSLLITDSLNSENSEKR